MARKKILKDKTQIVETALRLIESEGIGSVTMVRLSRELNVSSMTLYNYVRNAEEVLREILVLTTSDFFGQLYAILREMDSRGADVTEVYARAYALALYNLADHHRDICLYLVNNYARFYRDVELQPFYDPFRMFLLQCQEKDKKEREDVFFLYRSTVFALIRDHILCSPSFMKDEYLCLVDRFIMRMFPL